MTRKRVIFIALLVSIGLWSLGLRQSATAQYSGQSEIKIQVVGDSSEVDVDGGTDIDGPVDTTKPESEHTALPDTNNWWSGWLPGLGSSGPWLMWLGFALMGFMLGVLVEYKYLREGERRD